MTNMLDSFGLQSEIRNLIHKLNQKDEECLQLRASKEKLESNISELKCMLNKERQARAGAEQEAKTKDFELAFLKTQLTRLDCKGENQKAQEDYREMIQLFNELEEKQNCILQENEEIKLKREFEMAVLARAREVSNNVRTLITGEPSQRRTGNDLQDLQDDLQQIKLNLA